MAPRTPPWEVRSSAIHGTGVFARRPIRAGRRVIEYTGERISHEEAARRYDDTVADFSHVLLFTVDEDIVLDGGVGGSEARFVNHSCEPSCQALEDGGRIFIEALRDIAKGEELTYEYDLTLDARHTKSVKARYACLCRTPACRGTLLAPKRRKR